MGEIVGGTIIFGEEDAEPLLWDDGSRISGH